LIIEIRDEAWAKDGGLVLLSVSLYGRKPDNKDNKDKGKGKGKDKKKKLEKKHCYYCGKLYSIKDEDDC
jgi:hypothetical protein